MAPTEKESAKINKEWNLPEGKIILPEERERGLVPGEDLIPRACHNWSFWKGNKAVDMRCHLSEHKLQGVRLHGQIYCDGVEFRNARISNLVSVTVYRGRYYRNRSEWTWVVKTRKYRYYLIEPEEFYEGKAKLWAAEYSPEEQPQMSEVLPKDNRPWWWRGLPTWGELRVWARKDPEAKKCKGREKTSGDVHRASDDVETESDEHTDGGDEPNESEESNDSTVDPANDYSSELSVDIPEHQAETSNNIHSELVAAITSGHEMAEGVAVTCDIEVIGDSQYSPESTPGTPETVLDDVSHGEDLELGSDLQTLSCDLRTHESSPPVDSSNVQLPPPPPPPPLSPRVSPLPSEPSLTDANGHPGSKALTPTADVTESQTTPPFAPHAEHAGPGGVGTPSIEKLPPHDIFTPFDEHTITYLCAPADPEGGTVPISDVQTHEPESFDHRRHVELERELLTDEYHSLVPYHQRLDAQGEPGHRYIFWAPDDMHHPSQ